ncbi:MAG: hypothetical protein A2171_01660 [Candidatus Levybacteria bacterium RBG_13_35_9]|nr:MAG: hypothetical protein A2171_01660 [Candidatus Levybacteria bacterium RBG_13_35_9]
MNREKEVSCVISGSFGKFKPEIDRAIDNFRDLGVTVLAPGKGWLYIPPQRQYSRSAFFRPLHSEVGRTIKQIEDEFLDAIRNSDFLYVVNPDGFIGQTVGMEIGFAVACDKPVYSQKQIPVGLEFDPVWAEIVTSIKPLAPEEIVRQIAERKLSKL